MWIALAVALWLAIGSVLAWRLGISSVNQGVSAGERRAVGLVVLFGWPLLAAVILLFLLLFWDLLFLHDEIRRLESEEAKTRS